VDDVLVEVTIAVELVAEGAVELVVELDPSTVDDVLVVVEVVVVVGTGVSLRRTVAKILSAVSMS
jgi:hypothetical protein